jgi:hypothetical protein
MVRFLYRWVQLSTNIPNRRASEQLLKMLLLTLLVRVQFLWFFVANGPNAPVLSASSAWNPRFIQSGI